ncbi:MAG: TatD family hydrolase [Actinomycetota bacterium]|nr:TatD family hydrolase [Actinomycetota bacterium]
MPESRWFDSHCHAHEDEDPAATAAEGLENGLVGMMLIGTTAATTERAIKVATELRPRFPQLSIAATAGIHPHDADEALAGSWEAFTRMVVEAPAGVLAGIGECGLDFYYDYSDRNAQREIFLRQIELANSLSLPLVIHTREAWDDTFELLREHSRTRIVFHCFTGGPAELKRCLEFDSLISFSGIVTFKSAAENAEAATLCPTERMLVETDSPYLTPVPYRGKPNKPHFVSLVGEFIAARRGMDPAELAAVTAANARAVFGLAEPTA